MDLVEDILASLVEKEVKNVFLAEDSSSELVLELVLLISIKTTLSTIKDTCVWGIIFEKSVY